MSLSIGTPVPQRSALATGQVVGRADIVCP